MTHPLRVAIVDDEPLAVQRLRILCAQINNVEIVGSASDDRTAQDLIRQVGPDVLLLDISMPGINGIEIARQIAEPPRRPLVVFVTAYSAFAVAAFDVSAIDYLLKPVSLPRLDLALQRARGALPASELSREAVERPEHDFWIPQGIGMKRIVASSIDALTAEGDYVRLHIGRETFLINLTMAVLEDRLASIGFLRIHRSTMVQTTRITGLSSAGGGTGNILLENGSHYRIGRKYYRKIRLLLTARRSPTSSLTSTLE